MTREEKYQADQSQLALEAAAERVEKSVTAIKRLQRCQGYAGRYDDYVRLVNQCDNDLIALRLAIEERGKI